MKASKLTLRSSLIFAFAAAFLLASVSSIVLAGGFGPGHKESKSMGPVSSYMAAGIQTAHEFAFDRAKLMKNLDRNLTLINGAMISSGSLGFPLKLIVFPELTIHGAPYADPKEYWKKDLLVTIPGPETDKFVELAKKYNIYICPGSWLEKDPAYPNHIFNTAFIVGPEGVILRYRKIYNWEIGEYMYTSPHRIKGYDFKKDPAFPVVKTPIGTLGVAICYDFIFPEVTRELTMQGAEVLIRASAYMNPWGTDLPMNWWTTISQVRSLENVAYGIHVNLGGTQKEAFPYSFSGGSCIVDYEGRIVSQINRDGEQIIIGPIYLDALREWRANSYEHVMPAQLRSEVHTYLSESWHPGGVLKKDEHATLESSMKAIDEGRKKVWGDIIEKYKRK